MDESHRPRAKGAARGRLDVGSGVGGTRQDGLQRTQRTMGAHRRLDARSCAVHPLRVEGAEAGTEATQLRLAHRRTEGAAGQVPQHDQPGVVALEHLRQAKPRAAATVGEHGGVAGKRPRVPALGIHPQDAGTAAPHPAAGRLVGQRVRAARPGADAGAQGLEVAVGARVDDEQPGVGVVEEHVLGGDPTDRLVPLLLTRRAPRIADGRPAVDVEQRGRARPRLVPQVPPGDRRPETLCQLVGPQQQAKGAHRRVVRSQPRVGVMGGHRSPPPPARRRAARGPRRGDPSRRPGHRRSTAPGRRRGPRRGRG